MLVKRRHAPLAGRWSLPGGVLELGETLEGGIAREVLEETGLVVDVGPLVGVVDRIVLDDVRRIRYHFVLVDYLCRPSGGALRSGSDASDAILVDPCELAPYDLPREASDMVARAVTMEGDRP